MSTHMLTEQNHRLAKMLLEQQGELNKARARVAELEAELKGSRAEVERLRSAQGRHEAELNAQQVSYAAKVERLTDERDEAFEQVHMLRAACESMEGA
tara:strand:- start:613 stop:906 length:294 start_codon:yes stop_codon:yes gene_type:complete